MRWIVLMGTVLLSACSALAPQLEALSLNVVGMQLPKVTSASSA